MSDAAQGIERSTGHPWSEWVAWLDNRGAGKLPHAQVAALTLTRIHELGITHHATNGKPFNDGWWAQSIAIAYERQILSRAKGQQHDGSFAASASKTVSGGIDDALALWLRAVEPLEEVDGVAFAATPSVTESEKWRYWRVPLVDGSRVQVDVSAKRVPGGAEAKSIIAVQHAKLGTTDDIARWKGFWKTLLGAL